MSPRASKRLARAEGTSYACEIHGDIGPHPLFLGPVPYCTDDACELRVTLCSRAPTAREMRGGGSWNEGPVSINSGTPGEDGR